MSFEPSTKDDLLDLWRSLFPRSYTVPIEEGNNGQGLDIYAQQAAQFSRLSEAIAVSTQAYYLRPHSSQVRPEAAGERRATGSVEVRRIGSAVGSLTLIAGTRLVVRERNSDGVEVDGVTFATSADATIPAGTLGPVTVPVTAERPGYQGNVTAESISAFAERGRATIPAAVVGAANDISDTPIPDFFTLAMIGQYVRIIGGPNAGTFPRRILSVTQGSPNVAVVDGPALVPGATTQVEVEEFADLSLTVSQPTATSGGRHGWLDAIGRDRGTGRAPGETDEDYRRRLVALPDVVSPAAILRILARILTPLGIGYAFSETRDPATLIGMIWDFHAFDYGTLVDGVVFAPATRFFLVRVGLGGEGEFGMPYDAPYPSNAYDAPGAALNFYDGYPAEYRALIEALYQSIERARAAGVGWALVSDPTL